LVTIDALTTPGAMCLDVMLVSYGHDSFVVA